MARDESGDALKEHARQNHKERVAKNPERIDYAIRQLEAHNIEYSLKNAATGHFHCRRVECRKGESTVIDCTELQSPAVNREKIKTPFATVVVGGTLDKPYYSIMYFEAGEMHIGFSSYNLAYVRQWLSEEFEVDSSDAGVAPVVHSYWESYSCSQFMGIDEWGEPKWRDGKFYVCRNRKCRRKTVVKSDYCPNCGAKMDGGADNALD